jgi:PleD family two-component response regulator
MNPSVRHPVLAGLDEAIHVCGQNGSPLSLVHLDIDGFRRQLVLHGHSMAFSKLRSVQRALADLMRSGDLGTPFGEHRVLVALPGRDVKQALAFADRVRLRLRPYGLDGGVSIAVVQLAAAAPARGAEMIAAARRLVFESKSMGGGHTLCTTLAPAALPALAQPEATLN